MVATTTSPNVDNYFIGKGIVHFGPQGQSAASSAEWRDVGNCPIFEFLAKPTKLDHYSSRLGISTKDKSVVTKLEGTLTMSLEEFTPDNLAVALMGHAPSGDSLDILSAAEVVRAVKMVGTNDVGARVTVCFPNVSITPSKAISFIADTWGAFELTGDVLVDISTGKFGSFDWAQGISGGGGG
jgi:hypothetical protein